LKESSGQELVGSRARIVAADDEGLRGGLGRETYGQDLFVGCGHLFVEVGLKTYEQVAASTSRLDLDRFIARARDSANDKDPMIVKGGFVVSLNELEKIVVD
jgi:hypothetical protein